MLNINCHIVDNKSVIQYLNHIGIYNIITSPTTIRIRIRNPQQEISKH